MNIQPVSALYAELCVLAGADEQLRRDLWQSLEKYDIFARTSHTSFAETCRQFIAAKRVDGLSEKTLAGYEIDLRIFGAFLNGKQPAEITTDDVRAFLSYLQADCRVCKSTALTYLIVLRSFFGWLVREELLLRNPCNKIRSAKIDRMRTRKPLTPEAVERARRACISLREQLAFELLISTGCRLGELENLSPNAIDLQARSIVVTGKGDKTRTVYFSTRAKVLIMEYLQKHPGAKRILPGGRQIEKTTLAIGKRAGLEEKLIPHRLRHTFATHALESGMNIIVIQQLLGHTSLDTTQIYARISHVAVRRAYEQCIP